MIFVVVFPCVGLGMMKNDDGVGDGCTKDRREGERQQHKEAKAKRNKESSYLSLMVHTIQQVGDATLDHNNGHIFIPVLSPAVH